MSAAEPVQLATLIVTGGAVAFALAISVWACWIVIRTRQVRTLWRDRLITAHDRTEYVENLFTAYPGVVIVRDALPTDRDTGSGRARLYGSPAALAAIGVGPSDTMLGDGLAQQIMESLSGAPAWTGAGDVTTLGQHMQTLMEKGTPFFITIESPSGHLIQVDGRPAGRQLVIWLTDPAVRHGENLPCPDPIGETVSVSKEPFAFLDMFNRAPVPAWRMNTAGRLSWVNTAYVRAVDATDVEDVLDRQLLLEPGLADRAREAVSSGAVCSVRRGVVLAGDRRLMALTTYPATGGVAGFGVDVTDGEEAKTTLDRFRKAHDLTLNHMTEGVAIFDRSKRLVFYNRAFSRLFDMEEAFLNDRPAHGVLFDRMREKRRLPERVDYSAWRASELARYESAPGTNVEPDELWPLPDGRTLRTARQRHPLGGLLYVFEDMTDQLSLQARYNTQIKVQRATLDKLYEAVAVFGSDGRLKLHNTAFETLWALDPGTLDAASFEDVAAACSVLYADLDAWNSLKARVTDPGPESRKTVAGEIHRKDGSILTWLSCPLPDGATLIAWIDITDSRRIEAALRDRAEALEASERIKTEFVAHVSYQLRTPLTTIQGYADMLAGGFAGALSDQQRDYTGAIRAASARLGKLIDDILDIAAIDAGRMELEPGVVNLGVIAEETSQLIATRANHSGIGINVDIDPEGPLVRGDAKRLKQVFYNLLLNAMDHVKPGGTIEIGTGIEDRAPIFRVTDNGVGIAPDRQAAIFEYFERGDNGGAGLGLALVNGIIGLHGGRVSLESEPGQGTRITCHLPRS